MPFSFPSSPSIGDKSTQNSREYEWSGYAWEIVATPAALSASVITSGTLDAARLPLATTGAAGAIIVGTGLGVSSGTVSVTYGTTSGTACQGNDSRLSDTRTPTDGSVTTAKIANDAVTYAKLQNVSATDRLLGRSSAGAGDVEEITCTAFGRSLIDDADAAAARTTLSVQPTASPAFTGAATVSSGNIGVSTSVGSAPTNGTAHALLLTSTTTAAVNVGPAVFFKGQTGNNTADYGFAGIQGVKDSSSSQNYAGALVFFVQTGGGASALSEAMRCRTDHSTGAVLTVMAGQLQVTAGSVSACGVAFSGDGNTGLAQIGGADTASLVTAGVERMRVKSTGSVRFVPLSADPSSGNDAGDVYYNSSTNKLRVYNGTSWVDLH